jgi:glycosyltransferase involved in cell wall biosynthesis
MGIETRHVYLSKELVKQGHHVQLFISDSNHQLSAKPLVYKENVDGIEIEWLKTFKYLKAYGIKRILSWIHFEMVLRKRLMKLTVKPNVAIVSSLSLLSIINGIWLKKKYGCKLVFEVRDIWPLVLTRISSLSTSNIMYRVLEKVEQKGYEKSDLIMGTMPNLKEHIHKTQPNKKVLWIPHLINPSVKLDNDHSYVDDLKLLRRNSNTKLIAYAGSINKSSSIELLIKVAEQMKDDNLNFVLLGDGPLLHELKTKYSGGNIHFFDKIKQSEVVAFLSDCDILYDGYLSSDIYKFGNSRNKYVDYCLARKPIVVSYEGYSFFVSKYDCGLIVKPESESELIQAFRLLVQKDETELGRLGQNAFNFATEHLNIEKQVTKLIEAIDSV